MISLSLELFFVVITAAGLLFFMGVWLFYDRRDKIYYDKQRQRKVYHCVRCGFLYTSKEEGINSNCPECGMTNTSLKF